MKKTLLLLSLATLMSACIVGRADHQILIDPTGGVTWVVLEQELRSVGEDRAERQSEEAELLQSMRVGLHPVALAFACLKPISVEHLVLRGERPYSVRTEARFTSIDDLVVDLLDRLGLDGTVTLTTVEDVTRLEVVVEHDGESGDSTDEDVLELADELDSYRLMMTEGIFVEAVGFELLEGGSVAVPLEQGEDEAEHGAPLVLALAWSTEGEW